MHCEFCGKFTPKMVCVDDTWLCEQDAQMLDALLEIASALQDDAKRLIRLLDGDEEVLTKRLWAIVSSTAAGVPFAEMVVKAAQVGNPLFSRN